MADVFVDAGDIAVTGSDIDLNGDSYTTSTSGSITFTGPVDLDSTGALTIQTAGADSDDITFTAAIDDTGSDSDLTINAGAEGDLSFGDSVGGVAAIKTITATAVDDVVIAGNAITSVGAISITGDATDAITLTGTSNTTTITTGGADTQDITIAGIIDDAAKDTTLALNAGAAGDVTLSAAVGSANEIAGLTITNAYNASLNAVRTEGSQSITTQNATTLNGAIVIDGVGSAADVFSVGNLVLGGDIAITNNGAEDGDDVTLQVRSQGLVIVSILMLHHWAM